MDRADLLALVNGKDPATRGATKFQQGSVSMVDRGPYEPQAIPTPALGMDRPPEEAVTQAPKAVEVELPRFANGRLMHPDSNLVNLSKE